MDEKIESWLTKEISERLKNGRRELARQGFVPRGQITMGYCDDDQPIPGGSSLSNRYARKAKVDDKVAPLIALAFQMKATGASVSEIAAATGLQQVSGRLDR